MARLGIFAPLFPLNMPTNSSKEHHLKNTTQLNIGLHKLDIIESYETLCAYFRFIFKGKSTLLCDAIIFFLAFVIIT